MDQSFTEINLAWTAGMSFAKPACAACPLYKLCPSNGSGEMDPIKAEAMVKSDKDFR